MNHRLPCHNFTSVRLCIAMLFVLSSGLHAATVPSSWDFGTDTGKHDIEDAASPFAQVNTWTSESDSARISMISTTFGSYANVVSFSDLGGVANQNNFQANLTFTITDGDNINEFSRFSLIALADGASESNVNATGITAEFLKNTNTNAYEIALRTGLNGTRVSGASAAFPGIGINDDLTGTVISMQLNGTYDGPNLIMDLLVSDANNNSQTLSNITVDSGDYSGTHFGMGARMGSSVQNELLTIDYHDFAVIPEPGTLALVGIALASLLFFRRK
ncbi:MAG: PEP-CTERM sorting domain-containing protein [Verrucomicrobia bacterium]|nr:PEP-CTERM sorting domain-containing protein [Verrucomicrobiota bacterium]MCH8512020.1 PEP-CTERM sorting domain-containing protein [Kiritimatiellia bacterium]